MKIILLFLFVFFINNSFCQTTQGIILSKEDYLQKSKSEKKTGLILLASGTTIATIGIAINVNSPRFLGDLNKEETFWVWASFAGILSDLIGIRLLIDSHKNKKKANKLSVGLGTYPLLLPQQNKFVISEQPIVTLKINICH